MIDRMTALDESARFLVTDITYVPALDKSWVLLKCDIVQGLRGRGAGAKVRPECDHKPLLSSWFW